NCFQPDWRCHAQRRRHRLAAPDIFPRAQKECIASHAACCRNAGTAAPPPASGWSAPSPYCGQALGGLMIFSYAFGFWEFLASAVVIGWMLVVAIRLREIRDELRETKKLLTKNFPAEKTMEEALREQSDAAENR